MSHLPKAFMRLAAGFPIGLGAYFLACTKHEPPESLKRIVFLWIKQWEESFATAKQPTRSSIIEDDLAAQGFLELMRELRSVFLQDAACFQAEHSDLLIYNDLVFQHLA